uniref:Uncharacterized protein n=1 Tax=Arundo donax TaxID=35708 RepID=A0A0A8Y9W3_ARUDO
MFCKSLMIPHATISNRIFSQNVSNLEWNTLIIRNVLDLQQGNLRDLAL